MPNTDECACISLKLDTERLTGDPSLLSPVPLLTATKLQTPLLIIPRAHAPLADLRIPRDHIPVEIRTHPDAAALGTHRHGKILLHHALALIAPVAVHLVVVRALGVRRLAVARGLQVQAAWLAHAGPDTGRETGTGLTSRISRYTWGSVGYPLDLQQDKKMYREEVNESSNIISVHWFVCTILYLFIEHCFA